MTARRLQFCLLSGLLGVTLAVFAGVCGHEFVHFDDNFNIYNNSHIQGLTWENLEWMFTNVSYARRYMPLGWLSYAVDYQFFGLNPHAYHAGNLFLHLINVALLFFVLKRLLVMMQTGRSSARALQGIPSLQDGQFQSPGLLACTETPAVWCAAIGALFWTVNPLRVETVAWASSRIYCVAFSFAALSFLAWLQARELSKTALLSPALSSLKARRGCMPERGRMEVSKYARARVFYWLSIAAFAASLLTYPLALFAPIALFVLEFFLPRETGPLRMADWWGSGGWRLWRDKVPFLTLAGGVLVLAFFARMGTDAQYRPFTLAEFPASSRAMQAFYIWAYYAWKPWLPYDLAISYMTLHSFNPLAPHFLASAVAVLGVTIILIFLRRRWPGAFGLWFCHLVLLVPVLGLSEYPHSPYDRYSYLQGALWSVALAFGTRRLWERGALRGTGSEACVKIEPWTPFVGNFVENSSRDPGFLAQFRQSFRQSFRRRFGPMAVLHRLSSETAIPAAKAGVSAANINANETPIAAGGTPAPLTGQALAGIPLMRALGGIVVGTASALFALVAWQQVAVWRGTIPLYQNLLAHAGDHPDRARFDTVLGAHYLRAGLTNEAIASFKSAIRYEPLRPDRRFFDEGVLPVAYTHLGETYVRQGQYEEAFRQYQAAAQIDARGVTAILKIGSTLTQANCDEEALKWLCEAVRLIPSNSQAHHALALALFKLGREEEALGEIEQERALRMTNTQ